jgi:hypothetical protein
MRYLSKRQHDLVWLVLSKAVAELPADSVACYELTLAMDVLDELSVQLGYSEEVK